LLRAGKIWARKRRHNNRQFKPLKANKRNLRGKFLVSTRLVTLSHAFVFVWLFRQISVNFCSSMSSCNSFEIAEKKRIALAKLQAKKSQLLASASAGKSALTPTRAQQQVPNGKPKPNQPQAKSPLNFYRSPPAAQEKIGRTTSTSRDNKSSAFLNALKAIKQTSSRELSRGAAHPYHRPNGENGRNKPTLSLAPEKEKPMAMLLGNSITCNLFMVSTHRFAAQTSGYHEKLIAVFKNMPTRSYESQNRIWSFDLSDYQSLHTHAADLKPHVHMVGIPKKVQDLCRQPPTVSERSVLASIEPKLADKLLPFQQDGVW